MEKYIVKESESNKRIDGFLSEKEEELSRTAIQRLIEEGNILVNYKKVKVSYKIQKDDEIKLIVIGDNPGKDEQLLKNNRYLVGQAGKIADGFFKRNPELQTDFRKNVIILNKTPVHSAKTAQLKKIMKDGGEKICRLVEESQLWMAEQTAKLHCALVEGAESVQGAAGGVFPVPELWLVGYSELKPKHFFIPYRDRLKATYQAQNPEVWNKVYVFQHFSMNRFTIDLSEFSDEVSLQKIHELGIKHKNEIFD